MILTVAIGSKSGVTTSWRAKVVDDASKPVPGGECAIMRVAENRLLCRVQLPTDLIIRAPFVLLEAVVER